MRAEAGQRKGVGGRRAARVFGRGREGVSAGVRKGRGREGKEGVQRERLRQAWNEG